MRIHFNPQEEQEVLTRQDYQEILLARLAGGDLYANETRLKLREVDRRLDVFRDKPLYGGQKKRPILTDKVPSSHTMKIKN